MTAPARQPCRFSQRLRVRWAEVDMQKIVFNAHYLMYLDTAMAGYWRALALPYEAAMQRLGGDIYLRHVELDYAASAQLDDVLDVGLRCERIGTSSLRFAGYVQSEGKDLVQAQLTYVFANPATQQSCPVPLPLRDLVLGYEAGVSPAQVHCGDWETLGPEASALRRAVFMDEQGIAAALDGDAQDALATHALVRNRLGQAIATARLLQHDAASASLQRVAVRREVRGTAWGRLAVQALIGKARAQGVAMLRVSAQESAVGFWRRMAFVPDGVPYIEAGLQHQDLKLQIS